MKNSGRLPLLVCLLIVVEAANVAAVSTAVGGLAGIVVGFGFAILAVAGVFIRPNMSNWVNPLWSIISLPVNAAVIGKWALLVGVLMFGDPLIGWAVVMVVFVATQSALVFEIRKLLQ